METRTRKFVKLAETMAGTIIDMVRLLEIAE